MRGKTEKDCNGIEDEIYSKLNSNDFSWIPNNSTLTLRLIYFYKIYFNNI